MASGWNRHAPRFAESLGPDVSLNDLLRSLAENAIVVSLSMSCARASPTLLALLSLRPYQLYVQAALFTGVAIAVGRMLRTLQLWQQSKKTTAAQQSLIASQRKLLGLSPAPALPETPVKRTTIPPPAPLAPTIIATPPATSQLSKASQHSPWTTTPLPSGATPAPTPGGSSFGAPTPLSASSFGQRTPSLLSTTPVTTPEQARKFQERFLQDSGATSPPQGGDAFFYDASPYPTPDLEPSAPCPLPLGRNAAVYHPSWMNRKAAAAHTAERTVKVAAQEEVEHFLLQVLKISQRHLDDWTDRLREWLSQVALRPLLAQISTAHTTVNTLLEPLQDPLRLPPLPTVVAGGNPTASAAPATPPASAPATADIDAALAHCTARAQQLAALRPQEASQLLAAVTTYQRLLALLRGKAPADLLLPPGPPAYLYHRLTQLADSSCLRAFQWNGGARWAGRDWSADLPNDSCLVLYLFAAFLAAPGWDFCRPSGRGMPLHLGQLPTGSRTAGSGQYSAVVAQRIDRPPRGVDAIMATNCPGREPLFTVLLEGRTVTLSGQQGVFHAIVLFLLYHRQQYNGLLGEHYMADEALKLGEVLDAPAQGLGRGMLTFWRQRVLGL